MGARRKPLLPVDPPAGVETPPAWSLLLAVDGNADGPADAFLRGFEAGQLWSESACGPVNRVIHTSNHDLARRVAQARRMRLISTALDGPWLQVRLEYPKPDDRLVPANP
jgi:hypothetical protein